MAGNIIEITGAPFVYDGALVPLLDDVSRRVDTMRQGGRLSADTLRHLFGFFRIKNIYHSNAIEGNQLDLGETRLVVEQGLTITGKSLRDQAEARSLAQALDYLETLARMDRPVVQSDVRQIHKLILTGIDDREAGNYRNVEVKISGSSYAPPMPEEIPPQMTDFSDWIRASTETVNERDAIVIACAAHAWFAQIHPFIDGNGRTARILMNLILMRNRYPIAIISKEERTRYYDALEESQAANLSPFIHLVYESVLESLEAYEHAAEERRRQGEWIEAIADRLGAPERARLVNEYEIWSRAMDLFQEHFRVISENLYDAAEGFYQVYFKEFGNLDLDKYLALRGGQSTKRTWFFRIDFVRGDRSARYLFFFGFASYSMQDRAPVTLHIAREEPPGSFYYKRLRDIPTSDAPSFSEVGYDIQSERFIYINSSEDIREANVELIARQFITEIVQQFGA